MERSLTRLDEALPILGRALSLRTPFHKSLIESLKYLLEVCVEVIPPNLFSEATQKLASLNPESKFSGFLSLIHTDFFNAVDQQDVEKVNRIVERLGSDHFQLQETTYINMSDVNDYYSPLVKKICSQEILNKTHFLPLSSEEFKRAENSFRRGIEVYKESSPDFFEEFQHLVGEILILKAEGIKGGSSFDLFGMIHMCYLDKWEKVTDIVHFLVHEQSHLYVHLLAKDDPLVLNYSEMHEAPLRVEKRPLIGIYHAVFVLARMQYVLRKALSHNVIPDSEKVYCEETSDYFRKRCQFGLVTLKEHAQMTPLAEALMTSASKLL